MNAQELLKKRYIDSLKENSELYIGVELEYPIVNQKGEGTNIKIAQQLMYEIVKRLSFCAEKYDTQGNPIQLLHENGDCILFEVSYNTLEFAFAKARTIQEIEDRFKRYLEVIQEYLNKFHHELQGVGINPNWNKNDNRPVATPRYQMLSDFLSLSKNHLEMHSYPDYGAFICGNQVQLDVAKTDVFRLLNVFNKIEAVKAYLFANSPFSGLESDITIARDILWERSMHGKFRENIGLYTQEFKGIEDYLSYMEHSALFYAERNGELYYFEPIQAKNYLQQNSIVAYTSNGEKLTLKPLEKDFNLHRSYHYQELTSRGTIEFRSVCTQAFEKTFAPIAFHLGLFVNLTEFENLVENTSFFEVYGRYYSALRKRFSMQHLTAEEIQNMSLFAKELMNCAIKGLKSRGFHEEDYLIPLING